MCKFYTCLYFKTNSTSELSKNLGINVNKGNSIKNYIDINSTILGLKLSYHLLPKVVNKGLSMDEMKELVSSSKDKSFGGSQAISIEYLPGFNCLAAKSDLVTRHSLRRVVEYLRERGVNTTLITVKSHIEKGEPLKGYLIKRLYM